MARFFLARFAIFLGSLTAASILIFLLMDALGGDAAEILLGEDATPELLAALRAEMGLDRPAAIRYLEWVRGLVTFNLGDSFITKYDIGKELTRRLALTVPLAFVALIASALIGLPLGLIAAVKRHSFIGHVVHVISQVGIAIPTFWSGILLSLLFAVYLKVLPTGGYTRPSEDLGDAIRSLILPAAALTLVGSAVLARYARAAILDVMSEDYIRTARNLGLSQWQAILRHGIRNASIPLVTVLGLQFADLIGGAVVIESVFFLPGVGRLVIEAVSARDAIVVQSTVMVLTAFVLVLNFLTDFAYGIIDPRIRTGAPGH